MPLGLSAACHHHAVHVASRSDGARRDRCNLQCTRTLAFEWHSTLLHVADAAKEQTVSEAPGDDSESTAPKHARTLPELKKAAQAVSTRGTAAEKGSPSSSKKQANEKGKESDKAEETDNEDGDEEEEEEDLGQVLETQQKQQGGRFSRLDASPNDMGKDQPKKKANTAASGSAEFKPLSRSGPQASHGAVASPGGEGTVARSLFSKLAKVAGPKK